jgi:hypothetical protein
MIRCPCADLHLVRGEGANSAIADVRDLVRRIDFASSEYVLTLIV